MNWYYYCLLPIGWYFSCCAHQVNDHMQPFSHCTSFHLPEAFPFFNLVMAAVTSSMPMPSFSNCDSLHPALCISLLTEYPHTVVLCVGVFSQRRKATEYPHTEDYRVGVFTDNLLVAHNTGRGSCLHLDCQCGRRFTAWKETVTIVTSLESHHVTLSFTNQMHKWCTCFRQPCAHAQLLLAFCTCLKLPFPGLAH